MQSVANPGDKFIFSKRTLYLDDEKHRKYRLTNIIGITIGDTIKYPLSGKIEFQLVFEPLGNDVVVFDLRTANESYSAFAFWGIHQGDRVAYTPNAVFV